MEELETLVEKAQCGDLPAYGELVTRFQDMAGAYAYALLGDFHLAEDASQEAFVQAYLDLGKLDTPAAFPGWFRRIVFKHCDRLTRRRGLPLVSMEAAGPVAAVLPGPDVELEERQVRDRLDLAIGALPEDQRLVINLFYMSALSLRQIAAFLGAPVQTVKNRLYAARRRLEKELIDMARKKLQSKRPSRSDEFVVHVMDELSDLNDRGIQYILRLVDQKDCVIALKGAKEAVRRKILGNMSERVRTFMEEEIEALGEVEESEIRRCQQIFIDRLREIRSKPRTRNPKYGAMKRRLKKLLREKPVSRLDCDEITEVFAGLAYIVSEEGILALDDYEALVRQDEDDRLFGIGLSRAIAGVGSKVTTDILEKRKRLLLREQETRYSMIIEGIDHLQTRLTSHWMERQLRAHYTLEDE